MFFSIIYQFSIIILKQMSRGTTTVLSWVSRHPLNTCAHSLSGCPNILKQPRRQSAEESAEWTRRIFIIKTNYLVSITILWSILLMIFFVLIKEIPLLFEGWLLHPCKRLYIVSIIFQLITKNRKSTINYS